MSFAWPSLDGAMPLIDLASVADKALSTSSSMAMWSGVGVVGLGFLVRILTEAAKSSTTDGYVPAYLREILVLVGFVAVMAAYQPIVLGTIRIVSRLGSDMGSVSSLEDTFSRRMARFNGYINSQDEGSMWNYNFTLDGIVTRIFQLATMFLFIGVQCVMFVIKSVQLFALAAIITYGPILIGVATLGGIFASLGVAWFWALIEVSAWSFTVDILLHVFASFGSSVPEEFSYVQEIIVAVTLMALLIATIPLTGSLIRGHGASSLAQSVSYMAGQAMQSGGLGSQAAGGARRRAGGGTNRGSGAGATRGVGAEEGPVSVGVRQGLRRPLEGPAGASDGDSSFGAMGDKLRARQGHQATDTNSGQNSSRTGR